MNNPLISLPGKVLKGACVLFPFLLLSLAPLSCQKTSKKPNWRPVADQIQSTKIHGMNIFIDPPSLLEPLFEALHQGGERPVVGPRGFIHGDQVHREDDFAGFHFLVGSESIEKLKGKGMFGMVHRPAREPHPVEERFALLKRWRFPEPGVQFSLYFAGDKSLLESFLSDARIQSLAVPQPGDGQAADHRNDILLSRMAQALDHMVIQTDQGLPYFNVEIKDGNATLTHAGWDWCDISSRYLLAAAVLADKPLLPQDPGSLTQMERQVLTSIRQDGLAYRTASSFSSVEADLFDQGSVLLYLIERFRRTRNETFKELIEGMVAGLMKNAVPSEHGLRFEHPTLLPDGSRGLGEDNWDRADPCHHGGRLLYPLALYLALSPDSPNATKLYEGIESYVLKDSGVFGNDGSFSGHTHSRTNTLLGLLIHAQQTSDRETIAFVQRSVDWLVRSTPRWGWIYEFMPDPTKPQGAETRRAETDALADLIAMLLRLVEDQPDYWDVIDRYARNGLLQAQFTADRPREARGTFCGFCLPNRFGDKTMNCCTPAGAIALAQVYDGAVVRKDDSIYVNLLLDRNGQHVKIDTDTTPDTMRVRIETKTGGSLVVRLPSFVDPKNVRYVSGPKGAPAKNTIRFSNIKSGVVIQFEYDLPASTERIEVGGHTYTYEWKGHHVVDVQPQGRPFGFFQKEKATP